MIFDYRQVSRLKFSNQKCVPIANGTSAPITREGSIALTMSLKMDFVLVIPSLDYNLLSISPITNTLSCIVIF